VIKLKMYSAFIEYKKHPSAGVFLFTELHSHGKNISASGATICDMISSFIKKRCI